MQKTSERKAITIYDIAKAAGIFPATESTALTNNANVSKVKKDKVLLCNTFGNMEHEMQNIDMMRESSGPFLPATGRA